MRVPKGFVQTDMSFSQIEYGESHCFTQNKIGNDDIVSTGVVNKILSENKQNETSKFFKKKEIVQIYQRHKQTEKGEIEQRSQQ